MIFLMQHWRLRNSGWKVPVGFWAKKYYDPQVLYAAKLVFRHKNKKYIFVPKDSELLHL